MRPAHREEAVIELIPATPPGRRATVKADPVTLESAPEPKQTPSTRAVAAEPHSRKKAGTASIRSHEHPADLGQMIATMAHFLAAERNFHSGHELDGWLETERRVRLSFAD